MAKGLNLKATFSADTSGIQKGSKQAQQSLKDFQSVGGNALDSLAGAFGVNLGQVTQLSSAIAGMGVKFKQSLGGGTQAVGALNTSLSATKIAIGALGIGAVVAVFKELSAQAQVFYSTAEGSDFKGAAQSYRQMLTSQTALNSGAKTFGEQWQGVCNDFSRAKNIVLAIGSGIGDWFSNPTAAELPTIIGQHVQAFKDADTAARGAADAYYLLDDAMDSIRDTAPEVAQQMADISAYQLEMREGETGKDKLDAYNSALALINTTYDEQIARQQKVVDALKVQLGLYKSEGQANDELIQQEKDAEVKLINLNTTRNQQLKAMTREHKRILSEINKEAEANKKAKEEEEKRAATTKKIAENHAKAAQLSSDLAVSNSASSTLNSVFSDNNKTYQLNIKPKIVDSTDDSWKKWKSLVDTGILSIKTKVLFDKADMANINKQLSEGLSSIVSSAFSNLGSSLGDILSGRSAGTQGILKVFGEIATQLGELAIGIGTAELAIQTSLATFNPWIAIAAGTALVALGAWASNSASNIANGGSYSSSSATSSYATSSTTEAATTMKVEVVGTLTGNGDQLIGVINTANQKKNFRT